MEALLVWWNRCANLSTYCVASNSLSQCARYIFPDYSAARRPVAKDSALAKIKARRTRIKEAAQLARVAQATGTEQVTGGSTTGTAEPPANQTSGHSNTEDQRAPDPRNAPPGTVSPRDNATEPGTPPPHSGTTDDPGPSNRNRAGIRARPERVTRRK